ncbi:MAG: adenosylcobinamide-phosphate synthase CbiB [Pseudomonadota bacterium]
MVALGVDPAPGLMLGALAIEATFGWPEALYARIRHPVVWMGGLCSLGRGLLNRPSWPHALRYGSGLVTTLIVVAITIAMAAAVSFVLPDNALGFVAEAVIASSLLASRSLHGHVAAVAKPLMLGDIENARGAVSRIVGRDPSLLDETGITRAAIESLAENTSDGVIAPLFWGMLFGLPGIAAYKAINTLDSMIGHRNKEFAAFGGFAARLDDVANIVPSRVTGLAFVIVGLKPAALGVMIRDARRHRSPNAGWPEAAMAGALGVRLSGPRNYGGQASAEPWLNESAPDPQPADINYGLLIYRRTLLLFFLVLIAVVLGFGDG